MTNTINDLVEKIKTISTSRDNLILARNIVKAKLDQAQRDYKELDDFVEIKRRQLATATDNWITEIKKVK